MRMMLALACAATAAVATLAGGASPSRAGPNGALIVYWNESPFPSIWAIRPDGSHRRRILHNRQNAKRPRLSPDRTWVAFDGATPGTPPLSDFDIQLVRIGGRGLRTLTHGPKWDVDAQWSPDGRTLSFSRQPPRPTDASKSSIWIVRRDGSGLRRLVRGYGARWSPDGTRLVYEAPTAKSEGDLFVVDADGSDRRMVLSTPELEQPAGWSPDGSRILFPRYSGPTGRTAGVFVMDADGTGVRKLASGLAAGWSPDGTRTLYTSSFSGPLLVMNADGSRKHRIAAVAASEPDWR